MNLKKLDHVSYRDEGNVMLLILPESGRLRWKKELKIAFLLLNLNLITLNLIYCSLYFSLLFKDNNCDIVVRSKHV